MTRTITVASLALLMSSTSALALEGKALLEELLGKNRDRIAYGSIEETAADSFVLSDVKITTEDGTVQTAKRIAFEDFREEGPLVAVGTMTAEGFASPVKNEEGKEGSASVGTFTVREARLPRELFGGKIENAKGERVAIGSLTLESLEGDNDGDGKNDYRLARFGIEGLDAPLDWRLDPESIKAASGPAAAPLTVRSVSMDGLDVETPQGTLDLASFSIDDVRVPTTVDAGPLEWANTYSTMKMGKVSFAAGGKPIVSMDGLTASLTKASDTRVDSKSALEGIYVDLSAVPDPAFQRNAQALGYSELRGRMAGDGSYDTASGEIVVDDLVLDLENVAKLAINYKMTGYTPELARRINTLQVAAGQDGKPAANMVEMLSALGELKVESATVELTDDSITKKLLDFQAGQMNTTGDQLAAGAPMFVGIGMGSLRMPEFTQQVAEAVGTFLKNPGTLTVAAKPAAPVSFAQLMQAAQQAPRVVIEMLNVQVSAK